jgi:SP family xylose:H+ symportor-like MFS transporter
MEKSIMDSRKGTRVMLMIVGSFGMGVSLFAMGLAGTYQVTGSWLLTFVLVYIASFALSVGAAARVILSEFSQQRFAAGRWGYPQSVCGRQIP